MTRLKTPRVVALFALLCVVFGGISHSQSSVHIDALEWIQDAQEWRMNRFAPLYREINSRALRFAQPSEVIRGPDIVPGFFEDYRRATDAYVDLMDRFFADDSPITQLMISNDVRSSYLGSAMDAYSYNVQALHRVLESVAHGSATAREIQYWHQIATLWGSIARLNVDLHFNSE